MEAVDFHYPDCYEFHHGQRRSGSTARSEEHTSELQSHSDLVCRLLLEKKKHTHRTHSSPQTTVVPLPSSRQRAAPGRHPVHATRPAPPSAATSTHTPRGATSLTQRPRG